MKKTYALIILCSFILHAIMPSTGMAQAISLPRPGAMVMTSPAFTPSFLKGIVINPNDPFKFDFIVHRGDAPLTAAQKQDEYTALIKYFLAALAVPDDQQWVNLSPYEKDRIIPDTFGRTAMGRDLLAEDYILKQMVASMIYPESAIGKEFWNKVYAQAAAKFGNAKVPINTFNKVWIVPDKAVVYEKGNTAYVLENHLKVMLEEDYVSLAKSTAISSPKVSSGDVTTNKFGSDIIRSIVIPALEKEVNEGKNFAPLRQVFSGMLLATWYKKALKASILSKVYANKNKVQGVDQDPANNQLIYNQYLAAFKKGVFNMIKDPDTTDVVSGGTHQERFPRKYFSGGINNKFDAAMSVVDRAQAGQVRLTQDDLVGVGLQQFTPVSVDKAQLTREQANVQAKEDITILGFIEEVRLELGSRTYAIFKKERNILSLEDRMMKPLMLMPTDLRDGILFRLEGMGARSLNDLKRVLYAHGWAQPPDLELKTVGPERELVRNFLAKELLSKQETVSLRRATTLLGMSNAVNILIDKHRRDDDPKILNELRALAHHLVDMAQLSEGQQVWIDGREARVSNAPTWIALNSQRDYYVDVTFADEGHQVYHQALISTLSYAPSVKGTEDKASVAEWTRGGIDMNAANLDMMIKRDGAGVPLPVSQQNLDNIRINGLVPVILDIRPAVSAPSLAQLAG